MKRKIMITLDGSELSQKVLPTIRQLFPTTGNCGTGETELILVQVIDPLTYTPYISPLSPAMTWDPQLIEHEWVDNRRAIVEQMSQLAHLLEADGYHVRVHIPVGDSVREICALADEQQVDLLAMATHGRTGVKRLLMGSVAEGVMRALSLPILLIHPAKTETPEDIQHVDKQSPDALHLKSRISEVVYETPSV